MRTKRTKGDARKSCKIYAADAEYFDKLSVEAFAWYMRLMMSAAEEQSERSDFDWSMLPERVTSELLSNGLAYPENDKVIIVDFEQRLNRKERERKARWAEIKRNEELMAICAEINRNEKPQGVPDCAVVWGGNEKRWGTIEDVKFAITLHKYVSVHVEQFKFGITLINQCRLLRDEVGDVGAICIYKAVERVVSKGGKLRISNMREAIKWGM